VSDSKQRLDGVNSANSRVVDNKLPDLLQGLKSCHNPFQQTRQRLSSLVLRRMNFDPNMMVQTNPNQNLQKLTSISVSDLTKPFGQGYGQGCTSPLKIKTQQVFDWQNSNVKMSEPSSISLIKPRPP
jgi:hypothetical protein